ncbi:MAG: hypothetical protein IGR92_11130 [Leptolyngbyaceae cyanobacterium T60_A2020_046]|nr:hypothetical protein [Leptolyngbyaceae cyanobacterium T60_A2020_046]
MHRRSSKKTVAFGEMMTAPWKPPAIAGIAELFRDSWVEWGGSCAIALALDLKKSGYFAAFDGTAVPLAVGQF